MNSMNKHYSVTLLSPVTSVKSKRSEISAKPARHSADLATTTVDKKRNETHFNKMYNTIIIIYDLFAGGWRGPFK